MHCARRGSPRHNSIMHYNGSSPCFIVITAAALITGQHTNRWSYHDIIIHNTTCTCPAVSFLAVAGCCKVQYSILHLQEEAGSVTSPVECLQSLQPLEYSVKSNYVGNNDEVVDIAESWRRCLRSSAADVVWLLIWLLQPRYQSRQVNTALGFTTTTNLPPATRHRHSTWIKIQYQQGHPEIWLSCGLGILL